MQMNTNNKFLDSTKSHLKVRTGPSGLHFFNRNTGINALIDEIILPTNMWSKAPRQVSIALTNSCDLECPYCYAPKNSEMLSLEKLKGWLVDLDANGCIGVGFGGGEPTLYPYLVEICSFAIKETNLAVSMTTHAHRLSDDFLDKIAGKLHFIRVSMDGVGSTYEAIRCRSFDILIDRISSARRIIPFGINYVVNSTTFKDLNAAIRIATDLGAVEILLLPEEPTENSIGIDNETKIKLKKWINEYRGKVRLAVSANKAEGLPICNPLNSELGLSAFAHIDALGIIKKTSFDSNGVFICENGVMAAFEKLKTIKQEEFQ